MFEYEFAARVALAAHKALIYEVLTAPKPGLVDRFNNGAHEDMDVFSFVDSAHALLPYFYLCAKTGQLWEKGAESMLEVLRPEGLEAEQRMLRATGGVNTHKGAIFSMGLLCAAAGFCGENAAAEEICLTAGRIAAPVEKDFEAADFKAGTAGEKIYAATGIKGARGEAVAAFPSLREISLPALRGALERGLSLNDAAAETLALLILNCKDTAFIKRCAQRKQEPFLECVEKALKSPDRMEGLREADRIWSEAKVSAGGCADLLALTLFLHFHCDI